MKLSQALLLLFASACQTDAFSSSPFYQSSPSSLQTTPSTFARPSTLILFATDEGDDSTADKAKDEVVDVEVEKVVNDVVVPAIVSEEYEQLQSEQKEQEATLESLTQQMDELTEQINAKEAEIASKQDNWDGEKDDLLSKIAEFTAQLQQSQEQRDAEDAAKTGGVIELSNSLSLASSLYRASVLLLLLSPLLRWCR